MTYGRRRRCTRFTTVGSFASFARGARSRLCNRSEHRPALLCVQGQSPFVDKASKMVIHSRTRVDMAVSTKVARPTVVNKLRRDARLGAQTEYSDHIRRASLRSSAHLPQLKDVSHRPLSCRTCAWVGDERQEFQSRWASMPLSSRQVSSDDVLYERMNS